MAVATKQATIRSSCPHLIYHSQNRERTQWERVFSVWEWYWLHTRYKTIKQIDSYQTRMKYEYTCDGYISKNILFQWYLAADLCQPTHMFYHRSTLLCAFQPKFLPKTKRVLNFSQGTIIFLVLLYQKHGHKLSWQANLRKLEHLN